MLFFTWNVSLSVRNSWKQSVYSNALQSSDISTILIDNWGACLEDQTFCIFCNGWIDCRDAFHAVFC